MSGHRRKPSRRGLSPPNLLSWWALKRSPKQIKSYGLVSVFRLEAQSMLPAQMLDDGEIRTRLRPIQTFRHFRQNEAAGLAT
jgi:hypothetical protein